MTRDRRPAPASITARLLAGICVSLLAVAAWVGGFHMRLNGTYCETVLFFTTRCDALTHRTIQIHCLVTTCAWAVAVSGLRLPTAHAMRRWVCATTTLLMGWLIACLIAYR